MEEHVSYEATGHPSVFAQHNIQALLVKVTDRQMTVQTLITHRHKPYIQREAVQLFNRSKMLYIFVFCVSKEINTTKRKYEALPGNDQYE